MFYTSSTQYPLFFVETLIRKCAKQTQSTQIKRLSLLKKPDMQPVEQLRKQLKIKYLMKRLLEQNKY